MVFLVVQWVGENSISVLKDNQVNEKNIEEGATVSVTSKTDKAIYKAVVLKVFPTRSKANEFEASLLNKSRVQVPDSQGKKVKRARKPSQKIMDSVAEDDGESPEVREPEPKKTKEARKRTKGAAKKNGEEKSESNTQLQHTVQDERVQAILNGRRAEGTCTPSTSMQPPVAGNSETLVHVPPPPQIRTSPAQSAYTPQASPYPISSTPSYTHIAHQQQASPLQPSRSPLYTHETNQQKTVPAHTINRTPSPIISKQQLHTMSHYSGNSTPQPSHKNQQLRTPLQTNNVQMRPSYMSMLDDSDTDDLIELSPLRRPEATNRSSEWESFASHFTSEFEWLKAEVEMLRNEVKQLKKANKGSKERREQNKENPEEGSMEHLQGLVSHMTSPFEGLKKVLFYLFTEEELRCSSVKGITTVAGGANTALDKEKLSSLYCLMQKKYDVQKENTDKWIRGQQRKLREQYKRKNNANNL